MQRYLILYFPMPTLFTNGFSLSYALHTITIKVIWKKITAFGDDLSHTVVLYCPWTILLFQEIAHS